MLRLLLASFKACRRYRVKRGRRIWIEANKLVAGPVDEFPVAGVDGRRIGIFIYCESLK